MPGNRKLPNASGTRRIGTYQFAVLKYWVAMRNGPTSASPIANQYPMRYAFQVRSGWPSTNRPIRKATTPTPTRPRENV